MSSPLSKESLLKALEDHQSILKAVQEAAVFAQKRVTLVGGPVRDLLLGRKTLDLDLMVDHPARDFVENLAGGLKGKLRSHERFFTFTIELAVEPKRIDIATAREETYPEKGKLPVVVPSTIENDLKRRDFTVNAMAVRLDQGGFGALIDPYGGQEDLKRKEIRTLHAESFIDDPTRLFRAARFSGRLGFTVEAETKTLIEFALHKKVIEPVSIARKRHEFELVLKEENPIPILRILETWGLLAAVHPEWATLPIDLNEYEKTFLNQNSFLDRLITWFRPWGRDKTEHFLKALQFENKVKGPVLEALRS